MQRKMWTKICIVVILFESTMALESDVHIYVSPKGSDKNDGKSPETAVKTLDKAMILARKTYGKNTIAYIELMAGYFDLEKTLYVFRDRVTIRPYKNEEVHVTGGKRVPSSLFKRVTDQSVLSRFSTESREYVRVAHLPDVGITNYGTMSSYGFAKRWTAPLEVFYNGKPLHFARYPNEGFINIVEVLDGQNGTRFRYNSTQFKEPTEWHNESDPWTYGFWYNSWADRSVKLESLDASTETVNLTKSPQFGLRIGHWNDPHFRTQGGYFRFINILSALDSPGEYYMDREDGNLYVWFPSKDGNANASDIIYVSLINSCIMIQNGKYITLEGFTLEACRGYGVLGKGAQHVQISMMEIRNTGSTALFLKADSRNCTVSQCLIHDTDGGIYIQGGNRPKLESSGNIIVNNEIFQFARVAAVGCNGISVNGVGHVVRYNHVYFGQNTAVMYYGNDILMEYNLLHHNCLNTTDCGAFHTGRDWTTRGNIIRYNIVHHNVRLVLGGDVRGVMLDDQPSSTSIMHNVFYNNNVHANNSGGRYNVMANNVMYNATGYSIQVDNRGIRHRVDKQLIDRLYAVPYNSSLWIAHYPELAYLNLKNASLPEGNQIVTNLVFNNKGKEFVHGRTYAFSSPRYFNISETGFSLGKTDFYNVDAGDFRLKCHAAEWAKEVNFGLVVAPDSVGPRVPVGPPHMQRGLTTDADLSFRVFARRSLQTPTFQLQLICQMDRVKTTCLMYQRKNSVHVNIGGGRFNVIRNNIMYNATRYSMQVDSRGVGHKYDHWLIPRLRAVPYNNSMWTLRYPQLKYLNLKNASLPEGNQIVKNIVFNTLHKEYVHYSNVQSEYKKPRYFNISEIGFSVGPTDHFNVDIGDYRVKCYAAEWANHVNFEQVPAPNSVGPRFNVGPSYLDRGVSNTLNTVAASGVCTTLPPVTDAPVPSYLPDGSRDDTLYNVSKEGCWLSVSRCTDHPKTVGTYRDIYGEKHEYAADNETMCFQRAVVQWQYCGSHPNEQVAAIYGPSGATTLSGDGCYMAKYGCPKHGGPSDGQLITTGKIVRDSWAEQHQNATHNEEKCLSRAHAEWVWCGESKNHPVTSIFRPTGAVRTSGAGCWIHVQHCPKQPGTKSMFYDAWGASNRETDTIEVSCLQEAEYYWTQCGYDARYPVTAFYRPTTANTTYPGNILM